MDDDRYQELVEKRDRIGLSDEEASELGRMMADRMGKPYQSAKDLHPHYAKANGASRAARERADEREAS